MDFNNEGAQMAALAFLQWQWQRADVDRQTCFLYRKGKIERPNFPEALKPRRPDCFDALLDLLGRSGNFKRYHAIVVIWSMYGELTESQAGELRKKVGEVNWGDQKGQKWWPAFEAEVMRNESLTDQPVPKCCDDKTA